MKYVVFRQGRLLIPAVIPDCGVHDMLRIEHATPRSAGHFHMVGDRIAVDMEKKAESMDLGPHEDDVHLLSALMQDMGTSCFTEEPASRFSDD